MIGVDWWIVFLFTPIMAYGVFNELTRDKINPKFQRMVSLPLLVLSAWCILHIFQNS